MTKPKKLLVSSLFKRVQVHFICHKQKAPRLQRHNVILSTLILILSVNDMYYEQAFIIFFSYSYEFIVDNDFIIHANTKIFRNNIKF